MSGHRLRRVRRGLDSSPTPSELEAGAVAGIEPGVQRRRLTRLESIELEYAVIGRSRVKNWNGEDRGDEMVFLCVEDLNDVALRG